MPKMEAVVDSSVIGVKKEKYFTDFHCNTMLGVFSWSYSDELRSSRILFVCLCSSFLT